jgi:acyl-CoA thioesterase
MKQPMNIQEILNTTDRFAAGAGCRVTEVDATHAVAEMAVTKEHLNAGGVCQGGVIFTLADLTFAAIVNASGFMTPLTSGTIYYHRSTKLGETLVAEGKVMSDHHKLPCAVVEVYTQDGTHVASFTGEGYVTRAPLPVTPADPVSEA